MNAERSAHCYLPEPVQCVNLATLEGETKEIIFSFSLRFFSSLSRRCDAYKTRDDRKMRALKILFGCLQHLAMRKAEIISHSNFAFRKKRFFPPQRPADDCKQCPFEINYNYT